jgi:hypothetical protein
MKQERRPRSDPKKLLGIPRRGLTLFLKLLLRLARKLLLV